MRHDLVSSLSPAIFRQDVAAARAALKDVSGCDVVGFRAPCWSMPQAEWPYEILAQEGFRYSSSRLCIPGLGGGRPKASSVHGVLELPALSSAGGFLNWPAGGTVALRSAPLRLLRRERDRAVAGGRPAVYWFHPWELDGEAPKVGGSIPFRWARYSNLERLPVRLRLLVPPGDRTLGKIASALDARPRSGHTKSQQGLEPHG